MRSRILAFQWVVMAPLSLLVGGCSTSGTTPLDATASSDAVLDATNPTTMTQTIGPAGGVVAVAGLTLTLPPGALTTATAITVTRTDLPIPSDYVGYSPVWQFAPDGLVFALPATVEIGFVGDASRAGVYWSQPTGGYGPLRTSIVGTEAVASVLHFSSGFVGTPTGDAGADTDATTGSDVPVGTDVPPAMDAPPAMDVPPAMDLPPATDVPPATDLPSAPDALPSGDASAAVSSIHLIAPLSTSTVTTHTPTLHWTAPSSTSTHVDVCADRACTTVQQHYDTVSDSVTLTTPLTRGVHYWRARASAGTVYTPVWEFWVGARNATVDSSWGTTLDVNGDGYVDLVVSVGAEPSVTVSLYLGDGTGAYATAVTLPPPGGSTGFGCPVTAAGDLNGDGYADLLVGSNNASGPSGACGEGPTYVYFGSATGPGTAPSMLVAPSTWTNASLQVAGDINHDGYGDLVMTSSEGAALYLGSPAGISTTPTSLTLPSGLVTSGGDFNGDGYPDLAVSTSSVTTSSVVSVYFGSASGLASTPTTIPVAADFPDAVQTGLGATVGNADVNGEDRKSVV